MTLHNKIGCCIGTCHLLSFCIDRNDLYRISTSLQTEHIGTEIRSILTDELRINLLAINIYIVRGSSLERHPLQISRLQPSLRLSNLNDTGRILYASIFTRLHFLGKVDFSDRSIIFIIIATIIGSDDCLIPLKLYTCQLCSIIILHITCICRNTHLVHLAVTSNSMIHLISSRQSHHSCHTPQKERSPKYHFLHRIFLLTLFNDYFLTIDYINTLR